jgi:DNA-binding LacI/PurR family transcriptional regulator
MARAPTPLFSESGPNRPATLKDIAEKAGVSATTVSNVLLGREGNYSQETAKQIQDLAKKLGYRRNSVARNLVTRRSYTLGLLIEDSFNITHPENLYFVSFLQFFLQRAGELNHQVKLILQNGFDEESIVPRINDGSIDGLVGLVLSPENELTRWLATAEFLPSVLVGGESEQESPSSLDIDDEHSMAAVAEHLLSLGHRRFWFVGGLGKHPALAARLRGFRHALEQAEVPFGDECLLRTDIEGRDTHHVLETYCTLPEQDRPTAIVCVNDLIAISLLRQAEKAGISVPGNFSLTGFDGFPQGDWARPSLTTIRQPFDRFGPRAAELLVKGAEGDRSIHHDVFPGELIVRASTGPAPTG